MAQAVPPFPSGYPSQFRATVLGTVFAGRDRHLEALHAGDSVLLVPDPPGQTDPEVWVHVEAGDPVGHLPREISCWLWPWLRRGGAASAVALAVHGVDTPSWRRLLVEVHCEGAEAEGFGAKTGRGRGGPAVL